MTYKKPYTATGYQLAEQPSGTARLHSPDLILKHLENVNNRMTTESPSVLQLMYDSLPVRECNEQLGNKPPLVGCQAVDVRLFPGQAVKTVKADVKGVNEVIRSLLMASHGFGPKVFDTYRCAGAQQIVLKMERLDGTLTEWLDEHQDDRKACIQQLEECVRLFEAAKKAGLVNTDFHKGNIMFKQDSIGAIRWFMIDHGRTIRSTPLYKGDENQVPYHLSRNLARLRQGKGIAWGTTQ